MDALTTDHPYFRAEFDWLAVDEDGHVALISSGGFGPVAPASVYDAEFLEDVVETILELSSLEGPPIYSTTPPARFQRWLTPRR